MGLQKILVIPDCHHPYADEKAWRLVLKVAKAIKPQTLVTLGDFGDFYAVSTFSKDPARKLLLQDEIDSQNRALDELDALKIKNKYFLFGNHEVRLDNYVKTKAPELFGMLNLRHLLRLKERGWKVVDYMDYVTLGEISFTHDVGRSGAHAAAQSLADFGDNVVFGHSHRLATVYGGTARGRPHVSLNLGWLGNSRMIDYAHKAKVNRDWQLGFGVVYMDQRGVGHGFAVPIVEYKCVVDGKLFKL